LADVARQHSQDMVVHQFFSHISPTTGDLGDRLRAASVPYRQAGENIAIDYSVHEAHQALMNSPHHRDNILEPTFTHMGIGIIPVGPRLVVTQAFMRARHRAPPEHDSLLQLEGPATATKAVPTPNVTSSTQRQRPDRPAPSLQPPGSEQADPGGPVAPPSLGHSAPPWELPPTAVPPTPSVTYPAPRAPTTAALSPGIWLVAPDGSRRHLNVDLDTLQLILNSL
jgi:hypothetical protein